MPVHHIHNSVKNDPVLQGNRLYGPYLRPVVYGHFPISSELEPPTPDPLPDPLYCLRDIRQYSTPGKAALSSSFAQYRFMASSILESSTISSIILSSLHMIIKLAFNSPGRASSKKFLPNPIALRFIFPLSSRKRLLLARLIPLGSTPGTRPHCCTPIFKAYALFLYPNCLQAERRCSHSCSMNRYSRSHTKHRLTRSRCCSTDTPHECI